MCLDKNWCNEPVRMMRIDFAEGEISKLDLEEHARSIKEDWRVNCEWINGTLGFANAGHMTTFAAEGYPRHPGFKDLDLLRTYTPIAHKHGIRIVTYLNMHWYSYAFADLHPGWEQVLANGEKYGRVFPLYGTSTTFCVNSPWRDWAFGLMKEAIKTGVDGIFLDGPVIYPGTCYCEHCREQFRAKYGADIPSEDWTNPLWKKFVKFRDDSLARFMRDAQKNVNEVNPEGVVFINSGGWRANAWRVARDVENIESYQDFNLTESFFYYGVTAETYGSLMMGKFLRAGNKPPVVATHYMNGQWHYLLLPPAELTLALAQTAASGANPWIAFISSAIESSEDPVPPVAEIFGFMDDHKEIYTDTTSIAEVALLVSARTGRNYVSQHEEMYQDVGTNSEKNLVMDAKRDKLVDWASRKPKCEGLLSAAYQGYFAALTRGHILFDILWDAQITVEGLAKYRTLVLPDAACLNSKAAEAIKEYVRNGGNILASFEAGFYDADGNPTEVLMDLFGIEHIEGMLPVSMGENYLKVTEDCMGLQCGRLVERGPYALKVVANNTAETPGYFMEPTAGAYVPLPNVSPYPSLIVNSYGDGKAAYFPEAIGQFNSLGMLTAEQRICRMIQQLGGGTIMEVDAPKTVSVEVYEQVDQQRIIIHLVNNTVDGRPAGEFVPITNMRLKLRLQEPPTEVLPFRENKTLEVAYDRGFCDILVPNLLTYELIAVSR